MYRRLIVFAIAVCAVALIAMLIPLTLAAADNTRNQALGEQADQARRIAAKWQEEAREGHGDDHDELSLDHLDVRDAGSVTLMPPDGGYVGHTPSPGARDVVATAMRGASATALVDGYGYAASPAFLDEDRPGVVLVERTPAQLRQDLLATMSWLLLLCAALLAAAAFSAWILARRTVAPLQALAATAHSVADGDLTARAPDSSVSEIQQVSVALNRVTGRVEELLADEREYTAELAHQLRTPLTVLSVDLDAIGDAVLRDRLRDDLGAVNTMVDEIITTVRRPVREGLTAVSDAAAVVRSRVEFWRVLAEDQGRSLVTEVSDEPLPVRLAPEDLASALDILLQNVFVHTPESTPVSVRARRHADMVQVTVTDQGAGIDANAASAGTGLGLQIARRTARASGGELSVRTGASGTAVTLELGPPKP